MELKRIDRIAFGDVLEQNVFRHDSLLALPKGTVLKDKEFEYLKDLGVQTIYVSAKNPERVYDDKETLDIIKDTIYSCTLWDKRVANRMYPLLERRLRRKKEILNLFTLLRKVDHYSFEASLNIALVVGKVMIIDDKVDRDLVNLIYYSLIHDIGKIKVSKITTKEGQLSETEFQTVRRHPIMSYKLLKKFGFPSGDVLFALQTHERYDGSGYPSSLEKDEIEPLAQVIAIAEMYNALSSFRPYRPAFHPIEVRNKIEEEKDRSFSEVYVDLFLERYTPYRLGAPVELSNGLEGKVVKVNDRAPMFPVVQVFDQDTGKPSREINLVREPKIRITRVLI